MTIRNGKDKSAKEIVRLFRVWYLTNCKQGDKRSGFYCGITNDPETRKTTHEREDHGGKEIVTMFAVGNTNKPIGDSP